MKEKQVSGFTYVVEHTRGGEVLSAEIVHNLLPTEGLNHAVDVLLLAGAQQSNWYLALFEGNYTPTSTVTGATVVSVATECTAYDETTRQQWIGSAVSAGASSNTASKAVFTMNATKGVYGAFLVSSSVKSSTTGILLSIAQFPTVKNVIDNDILRVTASFTNVSAT